MACKIEGCNGKDYVGGLCSRHYERRRRTGTTNDGPKARGSLKERFERHYERRGLDECWLWTGKSVVDGYGTISIGGRRSKKMLAHRVAYELANGPIEYQSGYHGAVVRHTCDNAACVNPKHLVLGTQADNVKDMMDRGRFAVPNLRGEDHGNARFTEENIRYIKSSLKSDIELGAEFGCDRNVIYGIRAGKSWTHVDVEVAIKRHTNSGSGHHSSRLTDDDIRYIRNCSETSFELAAKFSMNYNSINKIRARTTWKHVK